ncbi:WxL protein peptidoglycan domain-containing protein [Microbacterium sp. RD1]|uniref:WxL protein peptidoglycan domain-containing protein n=1 Tax=Microbacterium sp. RD1 TaxID=3457313 RepID=UPI003FA5BAC6
MSRPFPFIPLGVVAAAAAVLSPAGMALAATGAAADPPAVAWTVETGDGSQGEDRPNFAYVAEPGDVFADTMRVTNTGTSPLALAVYSADAFTTPSGMIDLRTAEEPPEDAGAWITADTAQLDLAPGAQADIAFTVAVPGDAAPGDHSAGLITSFRGGAQAASIDVDRRLGTRVTVRVAGELAPAVEVHDVRAGYAPSWNPFEPGTLVLDYRMTNVGNTLATATDGSTAAGPFGAFAAAPGPLALPEVIPRSTVDVHREIPIAPWGWLSGEVVVHPEAVGIGMQTLAAVAVPYTVIALPWTLLLVFVVLVGVTAAVWLITRRRVRRRAEAGARGAG